MSPLNQIENWLTAIGNQNPNWNLIFQLQEDWSSANPNNRKSIRSSLTQKLGENSGFLTDPLDLAAPPRHSEWSISISHNAKVGGYIAVQRPIQIGWDIEEAQRVDVRTIQRVCSRREVGLAPSPSLLWSAKEAAYKSYEITKQEVVLSNIEVTDWRSFEQNGEPNRDFVFRASCETISNFNSLSVGRAATFDPYTISVHAFFPSTLVRNIR